MFTRWLCFLLFLLPLQSSYSEEKETLRSLLICDTQSDLETPVKNDVIHFKSVLRIIARKAKMKLHTTVLNGSKANFGKIKSLTKSLSQTHGVSLFYFTGHGFRLPGVESPWPRIFFQKAQKSMNPESIYSILKQGEIYSLGLFPKDSERDPYNLSMQKGEIVSPDNYLFMPTKNYEQHVLSYTLSDPKAFHKLIKWIEAVQGYHEDTETGEAHYSNLFYQPTHQSCASFASTFRDYAIELGAKSQKLSHKKISTRSEIGVRIKKRLLNYFITSQLGRNKFKFEQGIEYAGIKNFNITHLNPGKMYLPIDLILDHQKMP